MLILTCKDASVWMVRLQDENLPLATRAKLRLHLLICDRCREFNHQLNTLKQGVQSWREQTND